MILSWTSGMYYTRHTMVHSLLSTAFEYRVCLEQGFSCLCQCILLYYFLAPSVTIDDDQLSSRDYSRTLVIRTGSKEGYRLIYRESIQDRVWGWSV